MQIKDLSKELKVTNKELIAFLNDNGFDLKNHMSTVTDEMVELAKGMFEQPIEEVKVEKTFETKKWEQTTPVLCRSVCPGWLGVTGLRSGQYYTFQAPGDECEIEYGDLFALKNKRSDYIFKPLFIIEDEELLEEPRWKDVSQFYSEQVYGMEDIDAALNMPVSSFESTLTRLPKGLMKALLVEVAERIENKTFDSINKIRIIDRVCGTDFYHTMPID